MALKSRRTWTRHCPLRCAPLVPVADGASWLSYRLAMALAPHPHSSSALRKPSLWRLAARQALRDFQAGELRLLALAVVLAVAALTAVAFFADRLNTGLARDARQLLGGDAVVASDQPAPGISHEAGAGLGAGDGWQCQLSQHGPRTGR